MKIKKIALLALVLALLSIASYFALKRMQWLKLANNIVTDDMNYESESADIITTEASNNRQDLENIKRQLASHPLLPFQFTHEEVLNFDLAILMYDYQSTLDILLDAFATPQKRNASIEKIIALRESFLKQKERIRRYWELGYDNSEAKTIAQEAAHDLLLPEDLGKLAKRAVYASDFDQLLLQYLNAINELIAQLKNKPNEVIKQINALRAAYKEQKALLNQYWDIKRRKRSY